MQLPPSLREAIDRELEGVSLRDLAQASELLSRRYRAEVHDHRFHVADELTARAYLTTRLPATYAAIARCLESVAEARPDFAPRSLLDVGAGPGTATWAAAEQWPDLRQAFLVEGSAAMQAVGVRLTAPLTVQTEWRSAAVDTGLPGLETRDLVLMAYVLDELEPFARDSLVRRLWEVTGDVLVVVEPGTSAGWQRILRVRTQLIAAGANLLAPCPHAKACPLSAPDWCHFSARVGRSRLHREAKGGTVPWEDEKFIYLAASRHPGRQSGARVIAPPIAGKAATTLKLCEANGHAEERTFAKRERESFQAVRRLRWGDLIPESPAS